MRWPGNPLEHMPKATIQGEIHGSQGDNQRLLNHGLEKYDQLFIEGRAAIDIRGVSTRFAAFLIGVIIIFWTERLISGLARVLARLFSDALIDIRQAAHDAGLPVDDAIDSGLDEIFAEFNEGGTAYVGSIILLILPLFSIVTFLELILFEMAQGGLLNLVKLVVIGVHTISFVLLIGAFFFGGTIILRSPSSDERDRVMADSITQKSESNKHDQVLISCGDKHVPGIARELREDGWTVEPHRSGHWIARFVRRIRSIGNG